MSRCVLQFCACADNTTSASCSLIFDSSGMYVDYPSNHSACCRACGASEGCSPLLPTWISANPARKYIGSIVLDGRTCYSWCIPGAEANEDCWSFSVDASNGQQRACRYSELFGLPGTSITHNLTFSSYVVGPQPESVFAVRAECHKPCPRLFPTTCG